MNAVAPIADAKRILLVEDEMLIRMFAADALEDVGFEVLQADNAVEALAIFQAESSRLAGVIVDLGLPDRPGDQLAADLRAVRADLPIVIASGRSEQEIKTQFSGDARVGVLAKPYTSMLLLDCLESLGISSAQVA